MWADRYTSYGFYVIVVLLAITTLIHAIATVPSPPTAATISVVGSTMLDVTFEPPLTDGGAEVTSYQVDWDTEPGVYEIQTVQTKSWIGPNEVQTITTYACWTKDARTNQPTYVRTSQQYESCRRRRDVVHLNSTDILNPELI